MHEVAEDNPFVVQRKEELAWFGRVKRHDSLSKIPSFRTLWKLDDAVVGRGNAGWTQSKSGLPCPWQICSQGPPVEKTGRGSLLDRPSSPLPPPSSTTQSVKGLNCTELKQERCMPRRGSGLQSAVVAEVVVVVVVKVAADRWVPRARHRSSFCVKFR